MKSSLSRTASPQVACFSVRLHVNIEPARTEMLTEYTANESRKIEFFIFYSFCKFGNKKPCAHWNTHTKYQKGANIKLYKGDPKICLFLFCFFQFACNISIKKWKRYLNWCWWMPKYLGSMEIWGEGRMFFFCLIFSLFFGRIIYDLGFFFKKNKEKEKE